MPLSAVVTPSAQVAGGVAVGAVVLAVAAVAGAGVLAVAVAAAGLVVAWGWAGLLALPSPRGTAAVLALAGTAVVAAASPLGGADGVRWWAAGVSMGVVALLLHQLLRRDGRPRVATSVGGVALGLGVVASGALLVPVARGDAGAWLVAATLAAAGASGIIDVGGRWPAARPWLVPLGMLAGALAAVVAGTPGGAGVSALVLLGVAVGAVSHAARVIFAVLPTMAHARPQLVVALTSCLLPGPVTYAVARLLVPDALPG